MAEIGLIRVTAGMREQFFVSVSGSGRDLEYSKSRVEIRDRHLKIPRDSGYLNLNI